MILILRAMCGFIISCIVMYSKDVPFLEDFRISFVLISSYAVVYSFEFLIKKLKK